MAAVQVSRSTTPKGGDGRTPSPVFRSDLGELYRTDCLALLSRLSRQGVVVDMVFADPPYNIGKASWDKFDPEAYLNWMVEWIGASGALLREGGSLYVMGFPETLADVKYLVTRSSRDFTSCRWLTWHYRNKPSLNSTDWVRSQEAILHLRKGTKFTFNLDSVREPYNSHTLNYPGHEHGITSQYGNGRDESGKVYVWQPSKGGAKPRDVMIIPAICNQTDERAEHPTQKPEELLRKLVLASTDEGQTVLDPFGGSGTTYVACEQTGRRWIGGETDTRYCQVIESRIRRLPRHPLSYWLSIDKSREDNRNKVRGRALGKTLG
jgi:site-specific DNA-methyltransferase (adenine-specific)